LPDLRREEEARMSQRPNEKDFAEMFVELQDKLQIQVAILKRQTVNASNALIQIAVGRSMAGEVIHEAEMMKIAKQAIEANGLLSEEVMITEVPK